MARSAVKALFSGHVQGVGFRFTTRRVASGFDVTGTVRNLTDGRVEVIAEGERAEVEAFLDEVRSRMSGHVRNVTESWSVASGNYAEFRIAF